jgi:hypothetical protein
MEADLMAPEMEKAKRNSLERWRVFADMNIPKEVLLKLLEPEIQSAILAEREACAKICDDAKAYYENAVKAGMFKNNLETIRHASALASSMADNIRARSNAAPGNLVTTVFPANTLSTDESRLPEIENKALESPNLEYEGQDIPYSKLIDSDSVSA